MEGPLLGEALGDAQPIERVHPGEMLGDDAGLVALDAADEVPGEGKVGQCGDLGEGLLHVALAEVGQARLRALRGSRRSAGTS